MRKDGYTLFVHFVSFFSFFTFVRQRQVDGIGRTDGRIGTASGHDGIGNLENIARKIPIQAPPP